MRLQSIGRTTNLANSSVTFEVQQRVFNHLIFDASAAAVFDRITVTTEIRGANGSVILANNIPGTVIMDASSYEAGVNGGELSAFNALVDEVLKTAGTTFSKITRACAAWPVGQLAVTGDEVLYITIRGDSTAWGASDFLEVAHLQLGAAVNETPLVWRVTPDTNTRVANVRALYAYRASGTAESDAPNLTSGQLSYLLRDETGDEYQLPASLAYATGLALGSFGFRGASRTIPLLVDSAKGLGAPDYHVSVTGAAATLYQLVSASYHADEARAATKGVELVAQAERRVTAISSTPKAGALRKLGLLPKVADLRALRAAYQTGVAKVMGRRGGARR